MFAASAASHAYASPDDAFLKFLTDQQEQIQQGAAALDLPAAPVSTPAEFNAARIISERTRQIESVATGGDKAPKKYQQFKTLVFITLGMPEKSLRALFRQGAARRDIGFVLRGMSSPEIYREMKRVRGMMSKEGEANVFVDPLLFQNYRVDRAPFTLHRAADGRWYGLWGEIAIEGARELIEQGRGGRNRAPVGPLYSLKEPDMHEQMRKKFEAADWSRIEENAKRRAVRAEVNVALPTAERNRVRLVDVSSRLMRNVVGPDGRTLAAAGTIINPLEHVTLDDRYAVFDPTDRAELEVVMQWRRDHPSLKLIATHWDARLGAKFDVPVFVLDPLFKRRFQVERTPSLLEQDGLRMKVTEKRARP